MMISKIWIAKPFLSKKCEPVPFFKTFLLGAFSHNGKCEFSKFFFYTLYDLSEEINVHLLEGLFQIFCHKTQLSQKLLKIQKSIFYNMLIYFSSSVTLEMSTFEITAL
jgi:hypothetical protein